MPERFTKTPTPDSYVAAHLESKTLSSDKQKLRTYLSGFKYHRIEGEMIGDFPDKNELAEF